MEARRMNTSSNAWRILSTLDAHLDSPVELTLYGRAAIYLGFPQPPEETAFSRDVDAVLWLGQAEEMAAKTNFWEALERTNEQLADDGLYISHLFVEDQVILRLCWREVRAAIASDLRRLTVYRRSDLDLLLSKLMRDDAQDLRDALHIAAAGALTDGQIQEAFQQAVVPDVPEIADQFTICRAKFIQSRAA
jgi:hypothetical protein